MSTLPDLFHWLRPVRSSPDSATNRLTGRREYGDDRKSIIATLYARRYLGDPSPTRGIDAQEDLALTHFDKLAAGALVDERER